MSSHYLSDRQYKGLNRLGDVMAPGDGSFPSFSKCGCAEHADKIFMTMSETDLNDLKMLLGAISFWPNFLISGFLNSHWGFRSNSIVLGWSFTSLCEYWN